ncbi:MAG: ABC transporter permease [Calothrix sp. SM1_5_4]|nr:ABC transporter permease [Calothrix sp. SM1_5_4]
MRRDRTAMVSFTVIVAYIALALLCATDVVFTGFAVTNNAEAYFPPSASHWLGTDLFGRDVLARAAHGTVTSLTVGVFGAAIAIVVGTVFGAVAGYFGKWVDEIIVWFYTTVDTVPYILLVAAFSFIAGPGLSTICWAIGLTSWVSHCRIVRGEFMRQREREYVQARPC